MGRIEVATEEVAGEEGERVGEGVCGVCVESLQVVRGSPLALARRLEAMMHVLQGVDDIVDECGLG